MVDAQGAAVGVERGRLGARQGRLAAAGTLLVALWMAAIVADSVAGPVLAGWLLAAVLGAAASLAALPALGRLERTQAAAAERLERLSAALTGLISGAAGSLFLPVLGWPQRAALSIAACAGLAIALAEVGRQGTAFRLQLACCAGQFALAWWRLDQPGAPQVAVAFVAFGLLAAAASTSVDRLGRQALAASIERRRLADSLAAARDAAVAADRAKSHFIAAASHDLRQPAAALSLTASLLRRQVTDPSLAPAMLGLERSVAAMNELLEQLLDLSRLDAGRVVAEPRPVDIDALVDDLLREAEPQARARGLRLRAIRCGCELDCDPVLVSRMLRNLLDNALRHTARGRITVAARAGPAFELSVTDTGPGIPAEHQSRIFDEHYQVGNESRQRGRGLGLGLALVRRIAGLHRVSVTLRSTPGRGSRFRLRFQEARWRPLPTTPGPTVEAEADSPCPSPGQLADRRRVLLVEDDETLGDAFERWLAAAGFDVERCSDAPSAFAAIETSGGLHAVVSDFRLPGATDGIAVLERAAVRHPGATRVLVSGDIDPTLAGRAAAAGVPLLEKPLAPEALDRVLRGSLG